jgi:DNA repair exonuclease SbcCD ATPase subunit
MLKLKSLTAKNFMSVGNATQAVHFDRSDLTLVLGENLDLGGDDTGARNGTGKTTIINALSYGLYGQALTNIKKDNLINKTNGKNMVVTIDFEVNNKAYRIERGRKPTFTKLYIDGEEQTGYQDDSQGDSRETQADIERLLGMSHDMFKHVVALNTYTEPFLSMRANDQRQIIEQLLGVTILSEKAEQLKNLIKNTKDMIQEEKIRIKAVQDANLRIVEQIDNLKKRQRLWQTKHDEDCNKIEKNLISLGKIDIDAEIANHRLREQFLANKKLEDQLKSIEVRHNMWAKKHLDDCNAIKLNIANLSSIDIDSEIAIHRDIAEYDAKVKRRDEAKRWIASIDVANAKEEKLQEKLKKEIEDLKNHKCYACGSELHDNNQADILAAKEAALRESALQFIASEGQRMDHYTTLKEIGELTPPPKPYYKKLEEALNHRNTLENMNATLESRILEPSPFSEQIVELATELNNKEYIDESQIGKFHYDTIEDALNHRNTLEQLANLLLEKQSEADPYDEQIAEMEQNAIQEVTWNTINNLTQMQEHQEFLLKMLTNKDSFVRKKIIDQNLSYLNSRLGSYLAAIGLPHEVRFQNDLNVEITELGRDLDFDNLSRGERNRLILSLSWAFRDVWENLYQHINLLFIDELIDSGMDASGVENSLAILKRMGRERNKTIFLVSHREELSGRVNNILTVTKENGFTSFGSDIEIV